jgi:hypothetical protein
MDMQWSAKRSRSTGSSRRTVPGSEKEKEVLVYHRRSVQERDAAAARRVAMLEKNELEALEGMEQLGKGAKYDTRGILPGYVPAQIQKEVTASLLLLRMKRGIQKLVQRVRYGPNYQGKKD